MKATISLEDKNSVMRAYLKQVEVKDSLKQNLKKIVKAPWVAKIEQDGRLSFLRGQVDYSTSDPTGSRGVIHRFILDSGNCYRACVYERGRAKITNYRVNDDGETIKI